MNTKLVLFSHHYVSDVVIERINNLKRLNPNWDVKSIGFEGYNLLPDSIVVNKDKYPSNFELRGLHPNHHIDWFDPDFYLYDAYLQHPDYNGYFLYEYDTICNTSIDSFFDTSLDFFGNNVLNPAEEDWEWIQRYRSLNKYHTHFKSLYAYGQSTCIYMSNKILKYCVNEVIKNKHLYCNMLSEIRGGTLVKQITDLKVGVENISKYINWNSAYINVDLNTPHFYHPVK